MNLVYGVALLALTVLAVWLRGLFTNEVHKARIREYWRGGLAPVFRGLVFGDAGIVTITYTSKFTGFGTSTPPTAQQAAFLPVQTAEVAFADSDTQAVVFHNWGSLPGAASFASFLYPEVYMYCALTTTSGASFATNFTFGLANTNSITINKISIGTGSGGTFNVIMRLPHSIGG